MATIGHEIEKTVELIAHYVGTVAVLTKDLAWEQSQLDAARRRLDELTEAMRQGIG
jgi:hypothetical protein